MDRDRYTEFTNSGPVSPGPISENLTPKAEEGVTFNTHHSFIMQRMISNALFLASPPESPGQSTRLRHVPQQVPPQQMRQPAQQPMQQPMPQPMQQPMPQPMQPVYQIPNMQPHLPPQQPPMQRSSSSGRPSFSRDSWTGTAASNAAQAAQMAMSPRDIQMPPPPRSPGSMGGVRPSARTISRDLRQTSRTPSPPLTSPTNALSPNACSPSNQTDFMRSNCTSSMLKTTDIGMTGVLRDHDLMPAELHHQTRRTSLSASEGSVLLWDGATERRTRKLFKIQPIFSAVLVLPIVGFQVYQALTADGALTISLQRLIALAIVLPFAVPFLFGCLQYFSMALMHMFVSVRPCHDNSKYYSAIPTMRDPKAKLPPVIIQMPVYLESLEEVIVPTLQSVEQAVAAYQKAGGVAKIFVNDDGLQVMLARGMLKEFQERMKLYNRWKNILCVVARPQENRRGYFKKGSNMNFCLRVAQGVTRLVEEHGITAKQARQKLLKDQPVGQAFIAGGDLTLPHDAIILLIDSDTRMNPDCIIKTIPEFMADPALGYGQCITSALPDQREDYFQRMTWDFTHKIYYLAIMPDVARGHIAPLVGHNAFISWKALNACREENEFGTWWWSENHVSEDFDLAMRMMAKNFIGRYISYTEGFQEGISLTFPEEEKKVVKFAYGAAEMLLNPFKLWLFRSPISPLFRKFWGTKGVSFWSKIKMLFYLLEYFAIATAPLWVIFELTAILVFGPGYWKTQLGLVRSWDVTLFTLFIFSVMGPLGTIAFTFRARIRGRSNLIVEIWKQYKYTLLTTIQWTSYSLRFGNAIFRYMFSLRITSWGATSKEQEDDVFTDNEFRDVLVPNYANQILISLFFYCAWSTYTWSQSIPVPEGFGVYCIFFAYWAAPFVLNPNLIRFRY